MLKKKKLLKDHSLPALLVGAGILLLMLLLSGCGYNGTAVGSQPPPPTPTPTQPLQVKNCGAVHTIRNLVVPTEQQIAKDDETCFAQAYATCHPAAFAYSQASLDTGTIHNFRIQNQNGKCTITDMVQTYIAPKSPHTTGTYTCGSLELKVDGLHVYSCGTIGDVFVPLANTQ